MISSNTKEVTINYYLAMFRQRNPKVIPKKIMSNFDWAQINSVHLWYTKSQVLLCWWHVLHAWQQHIIISHYKELWELLKKWIRLTEESEFNEYWAKIQSLAPQSFIDLIKSYWLPHWKMWSAVWQKDWTIFKLCDTNMLVEA
jgi:hypothetical protein